MSTSISINIDTNDTNENTVAALLAASERLRGMAESMGTPPVTVTDNPDNKVWNTEHTPHHTEAAPGGPVMVAPEGVDVDSEGFPWDSRIHSSSKKKTVKDGVWKLARNIAGTPKLAEVQAELRAAMSVAAPVTDPGESGGYDAQDGGEVVTQAPAPAPAPEPAAPAPAPSPAAPQPMITKYLIDDKSYTIDQLRQSDWSDDQIATLETVEVPVEPDVADAMDFPTLLQKVTAAIKVQELDDATVLAAVNGVGLAGMHLLAARPEFVQQVHDTLF